MKQVTLPAIEANNSVTSAINKHQLVSLINRVLPAECQIKSAQDAWYVGTIASICITMIVPFALPLVAYCLSQAKKGGKK